VEVREGAARLTRAFGMSVSAYDADLTLDSAGVERDVRALRQVAVPDVGRPRAPRPVDYEPDDEWDRRYLKEAMDLGADLQTVADGLTGALPDNEGRTPGFFKLVLPGLEDEGSFTAALLAAVGADAARDQGDTLIGAAISDLGDRGSFEDRWRQVFEFRDEGAAWGIVALDQAVQRGPLIGSVQEAFNASFEELAQAPTSEPSGGGEPSSTDTGASGTPSAPGGGGGGTDGTDGGTTPPTTPVTPPPVVPPPLTPPPDSETPTVLDPIVEPVTELVDDLLGGLLG
jgi:hypothetical protein